MISLKAQLLYAQGRIGRRFKQNGGTHLPNCTTPQHLGRFI
jgi:hypothetical protein